MLDDNRKFIVYLHRNKINGKCYVGQTCQELKQRTGSKGQNYIECPIFGKAIKKYGWDNFEHIILEKNLTIDQANEREVYWGLFYHSLAPEGYNLKLGNNTHHVESDLSRERRSKASLKMWEDPEKHLKVQKKAKEMWEIASEECKSKMLANLDRTGLGGKRRSKRVKCIETGIIYESMREAERQTGINHSLISLVCQGKHQTTGGYHWEVVEENE